MSEFHLMRPEWLWCLLPAAALGVLLWLKRRQSGSWSSIIDPALLKHLVATEGSGRSRNLLPLLFCAWILAVIAASGPSLQKIPQPVLQKQDALVVVLDLSYSMKSGDLSPSRIDRARQKLLDLLDGRDEGQTGLIAFAGDPHIVTPLTDDNRTIANLLPALNPDMMPVPGSDPVAAVREAALLLESAGFNGGRILLLTDAVTNEESQLLAKTTSEASASLAIMGVGTPVGAPIPLTRGGFLKDESGAIVMPALDESTLRSTAELSGGRYMRLQIDDSDINYLLAGEPPVSTENTLAIDRSADSWEDQGYLLLLPLLPLLLALFRRGWVICLAAAVMLANPDRAVAGLWDDLWYTSDQQGQRMLQQGDPAAAATLFENPAWTGTASYQAGDYDSSTEAFASEDTADSWYNRGNALARGGHLEEAIAAYRESLARLADQQDAESNIALLERLLEQQQQQQQQEQNGDQQSPGEQGDPQQDEQTAQQNEDGSPGESATQQPNASGERETGQPDESQQSENAGGQEQAADSEPRDGSPQQAEVEDGDSQGEEANRVAAGVDPESEERDQEMEQWLRRVPDDPSGLLREKFRYQSQQREQGGRRNDAQYW